MEQPKNYRSKRKNIPPGHHPNEVYVLRDAREYIGESLLIIFSVLLALGLTEVANFFHEKSETRELLANVRAEIEQNKQKTQEQYVYQTRVLKNIDSAMNNKAFQSEIFTNDEFKLRKIAPDGVLYRDLDDVAWQVAKSHDIASKIDFKTMAMLTDIYDNQAKMMKVEDKVADVLLNRESRNPANAHVTLVLMRDNYKGWAYDRTPHMIDLYDYAIKVLSKK